VHALAEAASPGVPVHGALCFVDADLPLVGRRTFDGCHLLYPRELAKRIAAPGPLTPPQVPAVAAALARRLAPA
jgi:hypothetical protein